ncbi:hypothetical protein N7462_002126 [Penicillium macrosclerotiorum]|uniref:uncharacterized protein n=1 Tax=Penicillium macrosclerotiorum TaxID=303699 RepID=UPI002547A0B2|nr:uncharacterized protein N7462_002126 [Penicillium macrosclerotiorum]KAJ5692703.1 hypothetical protein N7462_002126 [Penicillium macrosclerotiorum]
MDPTTNELRKNDDPRRRESFGSQNSQTAKEFIESQIRLEADAREVLPYSFDSCTYALGPLRQQLFACLTCNPPPANSDGEYTAAAVCYSCSISCHGEHTLVELFNKRNFVCDCGTTRMPSTSSCTLREDSVTGRKGVHSQEAASSNKYNHNFRNQFCGCGEQYDPHQEKGTMFQCLGLGTIETGGCGEDWWHPECLIGLPRDWIKTQLAEKRPVALGGGDATGDTMRPLCPPGFPAEDDFDHLICFKCIDSNPWLKRYAGTPGFLPPVYQAGGLNKKQEQESTNESSDEGKNTDKASTDQKPQADTSKKRKATDDEPSQGEPSTKRTKEEKEVEKTAQETQSAKLATIDEEPSTNPITETNTSSTPPKHSSLPISVPCESFSLFLQADFHHRLCRCAECYPQLAPYPQLREEEETYEPPLSEDGDANGAASTGTGSLLERGEAALSNVDRVRAIEGAMIYNHLRDKVKDFLKPFAASGQAVSAEDIKAYFEKLRGDEQGIRDAAGQASAMGDGDNDAGEDNRREQNGKLGVYCRILCWISC